MSVPLKYETKKLMATPTCVLVTTGAVVTITAIAQTIMPTAIKTTRFVAAA